MKKCIFLFGEAEKGEFCLPYHCRSLEELCDTLGHPPQETLGMHFAIQSLLLHKDCIFFRVKEEGFSAEDYFRGLKMLEKNAQVQNLLAIGIPGVGCQKIIEATLPISTKFLSPILITEKDLYDYLTDPQIGLFS